jgi:4'-phosphopantetheinyl transferase EntD
MMPHKQYASTWQQQMAERLQADLYIVLSNTPVAWSELSTHEQAQLGAFCVAERRRHWWLGRSALKQVLAQLGLSLDTSELAFPHPWLSLSHSGDHALAVGTPDRVSGLGIDLELGRGPCREAALLFLGEQERLAWQRVPEVQQALLLRRLWCIKEAAFKANPHNGNTVLADYALEDIHATSGRIVSTTNTDLTIDYTSDEQRIGRDLACIALAVAR